MRPFLKTWVDAGLSFFYPEVCQVCTQERASVEECYVCGSCREDVEFIAEPFCQRCGMPCEGDVSTSFLCSDCREMTCYFSYARAAVAARGVVLDIIHRYKYSSAMWFEPFLASLLAQRAGPVLREQGWDMIIPVPLHPSREAERGFNQAERLARPLSKLTGIPLQTTRVLRRTRPTETQTRLSQTERAANVNRAFAVRKRGLVEGKRLVLVDDVRTTGATTNACAKVLLAAGAKEVCVWTVARALLE